MRIRLKPIVLKILKLLRLTPLSLARKVQLAFGAAVVFVLTVALILPYIWMAQLTKKASLDAGRASSQMLLRRHFQKQQVGETTLPALGNTGAVLDVNAPDLLWIRFTKEQDNKSAEDRHILTDEQRKMVELLKDDQSRDDNVTFARYDGLLHSNYVRIFRADDSCISCHNPQGSANPFSKNEPIGAAIVQRPADEVSNTTLMNLLWIIVAGLIGGTGAIVAFYMITQRVILRPIRQLRAMVNNVAEGNLDSRSSITTGDEYEKLANAFNHMLDSLQAFQEKLRQTNKQLDDKIAELSERNIELFKANKLKSEFLANISHEFKTPLNSILGFAQVLRDKTGFLQNDKNKRYAENIISSGNRLLTMINDLLSLAKTEAGKMELHIEQASISELVKDIIAQFSLQTKEKKIKIKLVVDDDIPTLLTDAGKVQQILYNFFSNAVKFTPERGRIEVRARLLRQENMVRIAVTDTGCGIAEPDKEKIFEKFQQVDGSLTRQTDGSGLGLTISKELATMLAGSIGLESEPGKGSTFWLDTPITLTKEKQTE